MEISEPNITLFHDQWFIQKGFTDQNMCRRFIDQHVRGYYKDGAIYFYRSPTFIFDDQDTDVMLANLDNLIAKLKELGLVQAGIGLNVYGGRGSRAQLIKTLTTN